MLDSTSRLYRPSANEIQRIKSEETARRRKMRIQQVRSIAMAHAAYTRKRYFEKQCAVLSKVAHEVQREKTRADIYALQAKQALLDKAVEKLGESHRVASSWEDPEKSEQKKAEKRQLKANERFNAAFLELMTDKAIKEWQASASVRYRVAALETEKKRATAVAALPPPPPAPYCDPSVTDKHANGTACAHCADVQDADNGQKVSVNVIDGDKNCLSGPRPISPPEVVNEKMQISETLLEKQPTAFDSAIAEEARLKEVDQGRLIQAVEESVKAEVRGQSAMRRARVQQHYDSLLRRLDEIARVDVRDHQRHLASSMALYSAAGEGSEALEKKRERAFEKELRQQMLQEPQKELPQQMPLEPNHESDSATVTETLVDLDGDSEVVAAELTAPSVHQADLPVRNRSPEPPLQVPEICGEQTQTSPATVSTENSPVCPMATSLGQEQISAENLNNQSFSYSKRGPSAGIRLAARLPPSADVTSHTPAFLSRMGPGDRPEMTDFRHYLHIPTVDTDTLSIQKLQEQLNQYFRTRSTIGDHSRFSDAFDFEREKEKLDMQVAEIDRQIEALHQSALARQCRLQDEGRRLTTGTVMDGERPVAFLPSSNELPAQPNEPCVTEVSGGSFTLSPTLSTSFASTGDHSPLRTATSAQVISSEKRDKARQLIKQQQTSSQVRLTSVSKKPRVTISPAQKPVALGICPSQTTASGTTNVVVLDRNSTASRPAKAARLSARPSALVNVVVANTGHDATSLPPASSKDSGRPTHICPSVRPTTTLSYELPQAVIFHPSAKILDESEDVSDLTHVTSPEPSLLSLGRTVCRAVSPVSAPETGFELTGSGSHHEAEPIRLKATASTFVVAKACSPITKRADEKPVPHFQQPLTCSVSTPPEVEDIDKSTSEVSYYSPQTNRMPSHFGVAKVASPNMRYAASDNRTLEVFVSGTSPDLRRSSLTIEGHPFGIECENKEDCQWPPPPSPIVVSPPAVQLEVGESTRLNTGSCDGISSGAINLKSETEGAKAAPCSVLRKSCPGLFSTNQALHNSSPTLDSPFPTTGRIPKLVTQSATTSQDGLYPSASRSTNRRNTMSSLTLDRRIQPICAPGEGRPLSISHPDLYRTKVQPQPVISESLGRSLGNLLTAPPAISSHCPSPLTSPRRFVTKARPQVTLTAPQLHVPNIHSPAINTTTSVPIAEMAKAPWTTVYLDTAHRPSSPELAQAPSVAQHSFDPDREPGACVVPKIPGVDQQSPRPLLTSRVGSYPSSRLLSGQSAPPPDAVGESLGSSRLTHRSSSNASLSDVGVTTLKLYADRGAPPAEAAMYHPESRRTVHRNQSCSVHVPHLLATDHIHMAQPHGGDLRSSSSGSPSLYEDVRTIHHTVADRKQAILKEYLQKNLDGLIDHTTTRTSSLTIEESSSTSLPSQLISTSKTMPTSDELSSKLSSLTVSSLLPLSTSIRDIPSDVDITSPSSPSTAFHSLPNSGSPADSSPDSPFAATWPGRTLVQRNNNNQQNTVLLSKHPIHLALPTRIHRGSPWYQTHRMQFRQLSVVEEASEVDGVLMKGETLCVYSPERLENQQLMSSPSLPASTPASSSRPSDQFSCLSMSAAPETETKETNRGLTTTTTPLSRGSAGDGATGSLCSSELTTLRYLHDVPYTPKSPTMDKSESAVSITDTSFLTPYVTAVSVSQREHSNPVSLNSSAATNRQLAVVTASDNGVSTSVGLSYDSATQGFVSLSSGCVEDSSVRRIDNEPVLAPISVCLIRFIKVGC
nr:unnamed protein product [Spirometra erinaceieuropaei]